MEVENCYTAITHDLTQTEPFFLQVYVEHFYSTCYQVTTNNSERTIIKFRVTCTCHQTSPSDLVMFYSFWELMHPGRWN